MTVKEIKSESNYFNLVAEAKELGVPFSKVKKEDLRAACIKARKAADKAAKKAASNEPATAPAVPVAIEIEPEHIEAITEMKTKKERVIALVTEYGYPVKVVAEHPLVNCHPTNAHAILRAAGMGRGTRTVSQEVKDRIRATVVAKIAAEAETAAEPTAADGDES
jgi:hypothetical protein